MNLIEIFNIKNILRPYKVSVLIILRLSINNISFIVFWNFLAVEKFFDGHGDVIIGKMEKFSVSMNEYSAIFG